MDSSAQSFSRRRQQRLSRRNSQRMLIRILAFAVVFVACYRREVYISNHLVNTLSSLPAAAVSMKDPTQFDRSFVRKWRHIHIQPISTKNFNQSGNSYNNTDADAIKISFQLYNPTDHPIHHTFNQYMKCTLGNLTEGKDKKVVFTGEVRSGIVPDVLMRNSNGRVLDFTTKISTSLKLLSIGDSVTIQYSYSLDEILGGASLSSRTVLWESWSGHVGGSVVYPTFGGGASATWRMTGLLSKAGEGKPAANREAKKGKGGGWSMKHVKRFLNHEQFGLEMARMQEMAETRVKMKKQSPNESRDVTFTKNTINSTPPLKKFEVVIFRIMHGWMNTNEMTSSRFLEAVQLAAELFSAETVILQTIPFTNNVKTEDDWNAINQVNGMMRSIAKSWNTQNSAPTMPKHVLIQEYGQYVNHIIWSNARYLGYDVSDPLDSTHEMFMTEGPTFLFDRLNDGKEWSPSIPMVCSDMESLGKKRDKCNRNYLFSDGMHVCPERLSFRYAASLACLIGCVYNRNGSYEQDLHGCEKECNDLFMTVAPIDEDWVNGAVTLAAFP